jgi:hypothetical protein
VLAQLDHQIIVKPFSCPIEHRLGGVKSNGNSLRVAVADQRQQPSITRTEVDEPLDMRR